MPEPLLTVLDVGDGNCAVLRDEFGVVVFDFPGGPVPRDYFRAVEATRIDAAFISHAHRDHCEGLTGHFGEDFPIGVIFMNPQRSMSKTRIYRQVIKAVTEAQFGPNPPRLVPFHSDIREPCMERGQLQIRIIAPPSHLAYSGSTRHWEDEHRSCGVVRIEIAETGCVLLPGDLDSQGMAAILRRNPEALRAKVLVFPHHGGRSNGNSKLFAEELVAAVEPESVAFSQARRGGHPRPDVVAGILEVAPNAHICCTQLAHKCDKRELHEKAVRKDISLPASGFNDPGGACCAGPIEIALGESDVRFVGREDHQLFVRDLVNASMCRPLP